MKYFFERADYLKEQIEDYVSDNLELFLKDFYALCYNNFYMFEYDKMPTEVKVSDVDSDTVFKMLLDFKEKIDKTPCNDVKSYSDENSFWRVSDIFKIKPKRFYLYGDEVIWDYMEFYFQLHDISIDLVPVEYVIERVEDILEIYYRYTTQYDEESISEFWNDVGFELIRIRYNFWCREMGLFEDDE